MHGRGWVVVRGIALLTDPGWVAELLTAAEGWGWVGHVVLGLVYVVSTVALVPASALTLGIGFLYGPIEGTATVLPAATVGATLSFMLGRRMLRGWVAKQAARHARFGALEAAVAKDGFKILLLVRLSPVFPFNVVNYLFGLTSISLPRYMVGSFLAMLPGTLLYATIGSMLSDAAQLASGERPDAGHLHTAVTWLGAIATLAVVIWTTRMARRVLRREAPDLA